MILFSRFGKKKPFRCLLAAQRFGLCMKSTFLLVQEMHIFFA